MTQQREAAQQRYLPTYFKYLLKSGRCKYLLLGYV